MLSTLYGHEHHDSLTLSVNTLRKAAIINQCNWRRRVARKELRSFKMAARETGAFKEENDKLEKRVEELTWRLQLKKRLREKS
ncbi:hypothetical protein L1887_37408 [Cichorium endivia]|nr:hypothetical protein L1887_37408 [Cichorium endivia]